MIIEKVIKMIFYKTTTNNNNFHKICNFFIIFLDFNIYFYNLFNIKNNE